MKEYCDPFDFFGVIGTGIPNKLGEVTIFKDQVLAVEVLMLR